MPQWHGIPLTERKTLSNLWCQLFASIRTNNANNALLVIGRRNGASTYSTEDVGVLETLAYQGATAMALAHLRHPIDQQQHELLHAHGRRSDSGMTTSTEEAPSLRPKKSRGH